MRVVYVTALVAAVALSSVGAHAQTLGDRNDGTRVRAASGAILNVRLTANLSTGYGWRMIGGAPAFRLVSQGYDPPPRRHGPVEFVGRPGMQRFQVRVLAPPGRRAVLRFAYRRWWSRLGLGRVWSATIVTTAPDR